MGARTSPPPGRPRQWLSLPKVARGLSLTGEQVVALIRAGELPATLVGGARWFVALDELEAYRMRRQHRGAP